jgi:hypothetical protein
VVAEFIAMFAARQRPTPWTGRSDVVVRIGERGLERGRPFPEQQPDADPLVLVLIHPDTETALTGILHCATLWPSRRGPALRERTTFTESRALFFVFNG